MDTIKWHSTWVIKKYTNEDYNKVNKHPYQVDVIEGNVVLNTGITALLNLLMGSGTAFNNANSRIGVGDSDVVASATQTGLLASTNKTYKAMATSYPIVSGQTITFKSVFGQSEANFHWKEFIVDNGSIALNRKVQSKGTKTSSNTWTVTLIITLS